MSTTIIDTMHAAPAILRGRRAQARRRLAELTKLIDTLTAERVLLEAELDSLLYPILDLPVDITSRIFLECLTIDPQPSLSSAPLCLTHICHQWRSIALATPLLWQSVTFDYEANGSKSHLHCICVIFWRVEPYDAHGPKAMTSLIWLSRKLSNNCEALLDMWLHHSAGAPLFLSFGCRNDFDTQRLIHISLIHCHRWREITLSGRVTLDVPTLHFPLLRKLTLGKHISRTITIQNAPVLCQMSTRLVPDPYYNVQLPWAQMTSLSVTTFQSPADCLHMLRPCSRRLLHFAHRHGIPHMSSGFHSSHITLEALESLDVRGPGIMPHLTLPRLRHLILMADFQTAAQRHIIRSLLGRSACALQRLSITFLETEYLNHAELHLSLQSVPTVTDLTLVLPAHVELSKLVACLSSRDTLPLLENLAIDAKPYDPRHGFLTSSNVSGAGPPPAVLKSFELSLRPHGNAEVQSPPGPLPEVAMVQFRALAAGGLKTRIRLGFFVVFETFSNLQTS
ncbi:hypothetical protein K438DRAFT_2019084 [Mycena galopus ATCC 62051]|nr:hypothetical protein K438DRAFT_2019084 [Mycena galopus ATCC 62051]